MFNEFQQRLAGPCPFTEDQYNALIAAGYDDDEIDVLAENIAQGFVVQDSWYYDGLED